MSWSSPFQQSGHWFKGNLHTHTTQSDGVLTPDQALSWYRSRGYDFVALSDHWYFTQGVHYDADFVTISAAEVQGSRYHLLTLGLKQLPPREWAEEPQRIIDSLKAQDALCYIAHPYWTGRPSTEICALEHLDGIEVFNAVCEASKGTGHARVHWDDCLSAGRRLTGLAVDDSHWHNDWQGIGYVMVRAQSLTETDLLSALAAGHFYSSTGPVIEDLRIVRPTGRQPELAVRCSPCEEIVFYTAGPRGQRIVAGPAEVLTHASLPLRFDQVFVRVECRSGTTGCAWSNPLYVSDVLGA
ncbi:MAG: CehA/McbA family metallohydrolase [Anaerolineae bacterium]